MRWSQRSDKIKAEEGLIRSKNFNNYSNWKYKFCELLNKAMVSSKLLSCCIEKTQQDSYNKF